MILTGFQTVNAGIETLTEALVLCTSTSIGCAECKARSYSLGVFAWPFFGQVRTYVLPSLCFKLGHKEAIATSTRFLGSLYSIFKGRGGGGKERFLHSHEPILLRENCHK